MRLPPRPVRRVLAPLLVGVELVLFVVFAGGAVLAGLAAPLTRRRRVLRICAFGVGYVCVEMAALGAALGLWARHPMAGRRPSPTGEWDAAHQRLLGWALGAALGLARRCFGFQVVVESAAAALDGDAPVLALARHGGPGDSFALVHMLSVAHRRRVRIVLKEILALDPALDVLLSRTGSCFLPPTRHRPGTPDRDDLASRLAELAGRLEGRDTLLVFPEGGNWTPARRWRAIRHLRAAERPEAARAAMLMSHVLPPRPGGVTAVLGRRPDLPVVLVAHAGLDRIVAAAQAWGALPLSAPMTVRAWPASPPPGPSAGEEDVAGWLTAEWATVDEWVDARRNGTARSPLAAPPAT